MRQIVASAAIAMISLGVSLGIAEGGLRLVLAREGCLQREAEESGPLRGLVQRR